MPPPEGKGCTLCPGSCAGADLGPLLTGELAWLWQQLAVVGDRRGDVDLSEGSAMVTAPADPGERAAALGLLPGRTLLAGASRRVDLAMLTQMLRVRGAQLTPGSVAAHGTGRALGVRFHQRAARTAAEAALAGDLGELVSQMPDRFRGSRDPAQVWAALRRAGWVARVTSAAEPHQLLVRAFSVIASLPMEGQRLDRRRLADRVLDDPHGLDDGSAVAGLVLAVLTALEAIISPVRPRDGWEHLGVDYDDLTGGLLAVGVHPAGWVLPAGCVATIPPRELVRCTWPAPDVVGTWVFVTENPSILGAVAAATVRDGQPRRVVCTSGTPSAREVAALGRLPEAGWRVAVRADFDRAGIGHVRSLLAGIPLSVPWRMSTRDYLACLERSPQAPALFGDRALETGWDVHLADSMRQHGQAGYEETLLAELTADVTTGTPGPSCISPA